MIHDLVSRQRLVALNPGPAFEAGIPSSARQARRFGGRARETGLDDPL